MADSPIEKTNFDGCNFVLMHDVHDMPEVEVITIPSGGFWGGVSEPTIAVAGLAVLNALFAATVLRIHNLPLRNQDLTAGN